MPYATQQMLDQIAEATGTIATSLHYTLGSGFDKFFDLSKFGEPVSEEMAAEFEKMHEAAKPNIVASIIEAHRQREAMPKIEVPQDQLISIYESFRRLLDLSQSRNGDDESEEVRKLKRAVFDEADRNAVFAGQWLPREIQTEIWKKEKS